MLETDVRGCFYEPQYSSEQLRPMEEQEAAKAAAATLEADQLPAADEEPAMETAAKACRAKWTSFCNVSLFSLLLKSKIRGVLFANVACSFYK